VVKTTDLSVLKKHGVKGRLGLDLNELIASGNFYNFSLNNISTRILENLTIDGQHKRVTALSKKELSEATLSLSAVANEPYLINLLINKAKKRENNALLASYYFDLGLIREVVFYKIQQLSQGYFLVNYPSLDKDPFQSRQLLRKVLASKPGDYDINWLKLLPANPELIKLVQEQIDVTDRLGKITLDLLIMPVLSAKRKQEQFDKINQTLNLLLPNPAVQKEVDFLQKNGVVDFDTQHLPNVLRSSIKQHGFLNIDQTYSDSSNVYFEQAKALFSQGHSINKVIELLYQSIGVSPRHEQSWVYLGSSLKYKKQYLAALACFQQASFLDHNDLENQANIADIYLQLKQFKVAKAYLYYLQHQTGKNLSAYTQKMIRTLQLIKDNS